jgi:hypothetical protein
MSDGAILFAIVFILLSSTLAFFPVFGESTECEMTAEGTYTISYDTNWEPNEFATGYTSEHISVEWIDEDMFRINVNIADSLWSGRVAAHCLQEVAAETIIARKSHRQGRQSIEEYLSQVFGGVGDTSWTK